MSRLTTELEDEIDESYTLFRSEWGTFWRSRRAISDDLGYKVEPLEAESIALKAAATLRQLRRSAKNQLDYIFDHFEE